MISNVEEYNSKKITVEEALGVFKSGDTFGTSVCALEPNTLYNKLHTLHGKVENLTMADGLTMNSYPFMTDPQYKGLVNMESFFFMGAARAAHKNQTCSFVPGHIHVAADRWRENKKINVFVGMASPMDEHGYMCMSLCLIQEKVLMEAADIVIMEVNPNVPKVFGDTEVHIRDVDYIMETNTPLPQLPVIKTTADEDTIGQYVASLINDGDTIQLGIGGIPNAVANALMNKHDLGIHTEMITNSMVDLIEAGVVTGRKKNLHKGKLVATFALGEKRLYDMLDMNPSIMMMQGGYTNNPYIIAQNDNMVSINTALTVDLTGQICSESIGSMQYSGTGGQCDTAVGATHAKNGRSIIAIKSTKKNGSISSICAQLPLGSVVSLSRNDIDYVITEYGIAHLRGRSIRERVNNLIMIAHPDFRTELRVSANKLMLW